MTQPGTQPLTRAQAELIAASALSHITAAPERIRAFLAFSGLTAGTICEAARQEAFLHTVMRFVLQGAPGSIDVPGQGSLSALRLLAAAQRLDGFRPADAPAHPRAA